MRKREHEPILPFFEIEEEKEEQERIDFMFSSLPHFPVPKNDNERLLEFQSRFRHGDDRSLCSMLALSERICRKLIAKEARKNPHVRNLSADERSIKAHDASMYLVERLLSEKDFFVSSSFTGYLYLRVRFELYDMSKADSLVDFVDEATLNDYRTR